MKLHFLYTKWHVFSCHSVRPSYKSWIFFIQVNVLLLTSFWVGSSAWSQTPPTDLLRLPTLEVRRIHSTVVNQEPDGAMQKPFV